MRCKLAAAVAYAARRLWRDGGRADCDDVVLDLLVEASVRMGEVYQPAQGAPALQALSSAPSHVQELVAKVLPLASSGPSTVKDRAKNVYSEVKFLGLQPGAVAVGGSVASGLHDPPSSSAPSVPSSAEVQAASEVQCDVLLRQAAASSTALAPATPAIVAGQPCPVTPPRVLLQKAVPPVFHNHEMCFGRQTDADTVGERVASGEHAVPLDMVSSDPCTSAAEMSSAYKVPSELLLRQAVASIAGLALPPQATVAEQPCLTTVPRQQEHLGEVGEDLPGEEAWGERCAKLAALISAADSDEGDAVDPAEVRGDDCPAVEGIDDRHLGRMAGSGVSYTFPW